MTRMCHHTTCVLEWMHTGDHEYESAAAAPSLPAAAGEPLNVTRIEELARRLERMADATRGGDDGSLRRDAIYLRSIAKPAVPCPSCAEVIELRRALASRESRIGELENENSALRSRL